MNTKATRFSREIGERAVHWVQACQADYASL